MVDPTPAVPGHVPDAIVIANKGRYGTGVEMRGAVASAGPVELGGGVGSEVLATHRAVRGSFGRPRPVALPAVDAPVVGSPPSTGGGIGAYRARVRGPLGGHPGRPRS